MSQPPVDEVRQLRARLDGLTIRDAARLGRRLKGLRRDNPDAVRKLAEQFTAAEALVATRIAAVPEITYPDLPVSQKRDEIAKAISENQVIVVAGETGSGKTTQLPKICLELGRGIRGTIGHTQPRRIAARTVAQRIADELHTPLGEAVGYTVRFTDQASDRTLIKLMTDGILLAEMQRDRRLLRYDTLILDEAHERSLNIDFLLGYLRELLPRRPDLKVIVTSATIEPGRFAAHFGGAEMICGAARRSSRCPAAPTRSRSVTAHWKSSSRTSRPRIPTTPTTRSCGRRSAARCAIRPRPSSTPSANSRPSHPATFWSSCPVSAKSATPLRHCALLRTGRGCWRCCRSTPGCPRPSSSGCSPPHTGRRVVLATNVAETSLTVPGIRYVVDPGTARISRYSRRTKVQRLPIEPISQASAAQRAGRSGRVAPGVCIRLYSEEDFEARPRFTDPEILRTNLAAVILQMAALQLGDVENFPFLDPPDKRSVRDGVQLLQELGAFDQHGAITELGRRLAQLPLDPRIGRMILAADAEGCVREVLVLAAALSIPDPRERPADREEAARQKHARFADEHSDFVSFLNLWRYLGEQRKERSGSSFRRMCREEFLHYLRIREWQDLVGQLRSIARDMGIVEGDPADPARVHAALTAGLLSHVGVREGETREYAGARNSRFVLAPGSVLTKKPPRWIVVADLVETSRLYGRIAARIEPEAVERVAGDLVQRTYSEPHWGARRGEVMAFERVTLYGLPLVVQRRVGYASIDPQVARELFIRHALVEGDWQTRHHFLRDNARLLEELTEMEERARRRDLVVGEDEIYALYDARVPADVVSARHFDAWWKKQRHRTPELLTFTRDDLLRSDDVDADRPDTWQAGDLSLPVTYRFEPGAADDGITVHVPVEVLARLGGDEFAWDIPALREELITALLRSLPKDLRRNFVPAPDTARALLATLNPDGEPLLEALQHELRRRTGVLVPIDAFDLDKIPAHLRVTFAVESADGTEMARGKDIDALQERLAAPVQQAVAGAVAGDLERTGLRIWPDDLDELPRTVERTAGGHTVRGFPALVDAGTAVNLRVFATEAEQGAAMGPGTRRLLRLSVTSPVKAVERAMNPRTRLLLGANPDGSLAALLDDCADAAADVLVPAPVWTRADFGALRDRVGKALVSTTLDVVGRVEKVLVAWSEVQIALPDKPPPAHAEAIGDIRAQLARLVPTGFVTATGATHLADLTRYLTAIVRRLDRLSRGVAADRDLMLRVHAVQAAYDDLVNALSPGRAAAADVRDIGRMIEELRVSLWAQQLGTARPVSEQRIYRAIDAV